MRHRIELWIIALAIAGCVGGLYLPGIVAPALAREGVEVVLLATALRCAFRQRGAARSSWLLITAGIGLWIVGDIVWDGYDIFASGPPAVSAADAFYLLGYPVIAAGLLLMLRRRSPSGNRDGLLDGLVLAAASTIAAWDFLIAPSGSSDLPLLQRITSAAYPLGDILLLAGLAWIAFSPGRRGRSTYFLFAALGLTLVLDVLYAVVLSGWFSYLVGGSYPLAYAMLTIALLQRDAPDIVESADHGRTMHPARIGFLSLAVLGAPTAAIVEASRGRAAPEVLIALSVTISAIVVIRFALVVHARDAAEGTLAFHATHDQLTHLMNRPILIERIEHALSLRAWRDSMALLYIDLDRFKPVNDSWGHRTGDAVLCSVAARLTSAVRPSDTVARIGGDEFVVLCEGLASQEDFVAIADRIVRSIEEPITIDGHVIVVSASMGVARPSASTTPETLLRDADAAMYRAKELGRNRWEVFDTALRAIVERRRSAEGALQQALSGDQLRILYQPLVRVSSGEIVGYEALLRWERPGFGLVGPDEFIPLAEETGLIIPIGTWVLEQACRQAVRWSEAAPDLPPPSVAVNLSGRQFDQPNLGAIVKRTLDDSGLDPRRLVLELTESLLIQSDARSLGALEQVKECGVRIAIDDFGTGFSGLAYLRKFPFDILKIDHSFVEDLAPPEADARIVNAIVALAHALGRTVVAEGVETPEQLAALREMGCDKAQGFLIARPLTADAAAILYRETNGDRSKRLTLHAS